MKGLGLKILLLLSLMGQSVFILGSTGSLSFPIVPSCIDQTLPSSKNTFSFLLEEDLYRSLPNIQVIHEIFSFFKGLPKAKSSISCNNLKSKSFHNPIYLFINNEQSEQFVAYFCEETNIKAIITINQNLLGQVYTSEITMEYAVYVVSVCSEGSYNLMRGECTSLPKKRGLDLTQDQKELYDYYEQEKTHGIPGAIKMLYAKDGMYKDLFDKMVNDLYLFVTQNNNPNFYWADSVNAVVSLLSLDFATDSQADTLLNLDQYFNKCQAGPIENLLNIYNLYLIHYRKHDESINNIFLTRLENLDIRIRNKLTFYQNCDYEASGSFSSNTGGLSRITYSYVNLRTTDGEAFCYCSYCFWCPSKVKITYEHFSKFSEISKTYIGDTWWYKNIDNCPDRLGSVSVALYSQSSEWKCLGLNGPCTDLTIKDSSATYTQTNSGFFLLYPSTCIGNRVMDLNSNLCCTENCGSCITEAKCAVCKQGYTLTADKTQCGCHGLTHCLSCKESLYACEVCESSYTLQIDGSCLRCGTNIGCTLCSDDYKICYQCEEGYYLKNQICESCESFSTGCSSCGYNSDGSSVSCSKCTLYYALSGSQCAYCNGINRCAACDASGSTCLKCINKYYLSSNFCQSCLDTFSNCAECGTYGGVCTKCNDMYAIQADGSCLKCNGIANCETCDSSGQLCGTCASGMHVKENSCAYCKDDYLHCANCSIDSGCTACSSPYALLNAECVPGHQYLKQDQVSLTFDDNYNQIIIDFSYKLPITNDCSIILNPTILGENPVCSFISMHQVRIVLGSGWEIKDTSDIYLDPTIITLDGPYYALPSSEIKTHVKYPNTNNIPPTAVIEGLNNIAISCQKLSISYTSSKSHGVALKTFSYLWSTDIPSGSASIVDPSMSTLYITDFTYIMNFNVFLQVSNIFGASAKAQYSVIVDPNNLKIAVALDTGDNLKILFPDSLIVQARIVDFCGIIGTLSYSWSISDSSISLRCYLNKCSFNGKQFNPANSYNLQVIAQITNSIGVYQSTAVTIITSEYSQAIVEIVQPSGNLHLGTHPTDEMIYYDSTSYDENGLNLAYSWSCTIPGLENLGNDLKASLNKLTIWTSLITKFDLTLRVSNGYKTSTKTIHITVTKDVDPLINVYFEQNPYLDQKLPKSSKIKILGHFNYPNLGEYDSVNLQWSITPLISLKLPSLSYLTIPAFSLNSGTYFITFLVTINGISNSAYTKLSINAGAACPVDAVKFRPEVGIKTSLPLIFTISNCVDSDVDDLPLKYTFGYSTAANKRVVYLTSASYNTEYAFKFPSGTIFANFTICDSLNDCTFAVSSPATVAKGRSRNLKDSAWIYDDYKQESQMYELPAVITYFLESYEIPDDLIDIMWTNFTDYINNQMLDIDLFMIVESIAFQFIKYQTTTLTFERLEAYINFVKVCLKELKAIDADEDLRVRELADLILDVSLEMPYLILANNLLGTLLGLNDMPTSAPYTQKTSRFALLCVEDVVNQLNSAVFTLGSLGLDVINASIPSTSMLEVKAVAYSLGNYSDIFSVSFKSNKALKNNSITNDTCEVSLKKGDILFEIPVSDNELRCIMWNNLAWVEEGCIILETVDGKSKVSITKSGVYTLTTVSSKYLSVPLYCILSLTVLALFLVPLFEYLDKIQIPIESNIGDSKEQQVIRVTQPELAFEEKTTPVTTTKPISYHLLISLFKPQKVFSRAKRIILFTSNLSLMIYFSNLILSKISISPFLSAVIASASVFPLSLLVSVLLSKIGKIRNAIGVLIMIFSFVVSIFGIFLLQAQPGWWISFLISGVVEFLVSQTVIMMLMKIIHQDN